MSEEQQTPIKGAPVSRETSERRETDTPPKNRPSSAYLYLLVLFGAAFLMLLLAYFVQQRNNAAVQEDLRMTTASKEELIENIKALEEEKQALETRITELEEELTQEKDFSYEFQVLYDGARNQASHLEYCLYKRSEAMELFGRLDKADAQGNRQLCRELIEWMEKPEGAPLKDFLPDKRDRESYDFGVADGLTPAERYQEIYDKLS